MSSLPSALELLLTLGILVEMRIPAPMIFGLLAGVSFAKVLTDASQLDTDYDFVIVGGKSPSSGQCTFIESRAR